MGRCSMRLFLIFVFLFIPACVPRSRVAEPDIVARLPKPIQQSAHCLVKQLGYAFDDPLPDYEEYEKERTIALHSSRGNLLGFVSLLEENGHSYVRYWNGNLRLDTPQISGYTSDILRDNWHRAEQAIEMCR